MEQLRTELAGTVLPVGCRVVESVSAARGLHKAVEAEHARAARCRLDAPAMLGRVLPGSTADRLAHDAPCPIAVVPAHWQGTDRLATIGLAFVDSPEGHEGGAALTCSPVALARS
jgi:hypothetical protein